jgi:hypothetical protein
MAVLVLLGMLAFFLAAQLAYMYVCMYVFIHALSSWHSSLKENYSIVCQTLLKWSGHWFDHFLADWTPPYFLPFPLIFSCFLGSFRCCICMWGLGKKISCILCLTYRVVDAEYILFSFVCLFVYCGIGRADQVSV